MTDDRGRVDPPGVDRLTIDLGGLLDHDVCRLALAYRRLSITESVEPPVCLISHRLAYGLRDVSHLRQVTLAALEDDALADADLAALATEAAATWSQPPGEGAR